MKLKTTLFTCALVAGLLAVSSPLSARSCFSFGFNLGGFFPVVQPVPVYAPPPPPCYYGPAPVIFGPYPVPPPYPYYSYPVYCPGPSFGFGCCR